MIKIENYFVYVSGENIIKEKGLTVKVDLSWFNSYDELCEFCNDVFQLARLNEKIVFTGEDCPMEVFKEFDRFLDPIEVENFYVFREMAENEEEFFLLMNGVPSRLLDSVVCVGSVNDYDDYIYDFYNDNWNLEEIPSILTSHINWNGVCCNHKREMLTKQHSLYDGSFAWIE